MSDVHKLIDENTHFSTSLSPSVYSVSKYESEREVWRGIEEGLDACIVNPSVILGPGNWEKGSAKLFKTVFDGLKFYTAGMNGFVGVDDLVEVMLRLMKEHVMGERFIVSAENVSYRQLFEWMAESLGVSPPRWKAGPVLSGMAWRALQLRQHLTGKRSSITKETAKTAQQIYRYNHSKLKNKLDFTFIPIREVVEKTAKMFLEDHGLKKSDFT
jgi:nucleoside-diphosphate-sugar epimerase